MHSETKKLLEQAIIESNIPEFRVNTAVLPSATAHEGDLKPRRNLKKLCQAHLLHLELDRSADGVDLALKVVAGVHEGGELTRLRQPGAEQTRDLLGNKGRNGNRYPSCQSKNTHGSSFARELVEMKYLVLLTQQKHPPSP